MKLKSLLGEALLEQLAHLGVGRGNDARQELEDGHLGPQTLPDRAELEPDVACADDNQVIGHPCEGERSSRIDDHFSVERKKRQFDGFRASREQDVAGRKLGAAALVQGDGDRLR